MTPRMPDGIPPPQGDFASQVILEIKSSYDPPDA